MKNEFIKETFIAASLVAAFQRGNVYHKKHMKDTEKQPVKNALCEKLRLLGEQYKVTICESQHVRNIEDLARYMSD